MALFSDRRDAGDSASQHMDISAIALYRLEPLNFIGGVLFLCR